MARAKVCWGGVRIKGARNRSVAPWRHVTIARHTRKCLWTQPWANEKRVRGWGWAGAHRCGNAEV